jgi:UBX domain-containing protein 6
VPAGGRDARVFLPAEACAAFSAELPEDFFARDAAEVQRDFELAKQRRERDSVLSTRAWKKGAAAAGGGGGGASAEQASEEARLRELSRPATIRVRMPDGELLQGSFGRREPVGALRAFVAECVKDPFRKFTLAFLTAPLDEDRGGGFSSAAGARGGGHDARRAAELRRDGSALRGANTRPNVGDGSRNHSNASSFGEGYAAHGTLEGAGLVPAALVTFAWAEPPAPGGISERQTSGGALKDELMRAAVPLE